MENRIMVGLITASTKINAANLARELLNRNLIACANLLPVRSIYRWEGKVCDEEEVLLIIKTTQSAFNAVMEAVKELHPYQNPECVAFPIEAGLPPYLNWVLETVKED